MNKPIVAESLSDFIYEKFEFGFPLKYLNGGVAIWDANLNCHHMTLYLKEILGFSNSQKQDQALLDREFLGYSDQIKSPDKRGWEARSKPYITDRGVRFFDIIVRPILNVQGELLGFMSVCQDITNHHEPFIFQEKLNGLLRCVAQGSSQAEVSTVIYDCIEHLGFREVTIVVYDQNVQRLEIVSRISRGSAKNADEGWSLEDESERKNPLVRAALEFKNSGRIANMIFNEINDPDWDLIRCPYACLPIVLGENLLGFLVLAQSHCYSLTPELLDSAGRTSLFLKNLAPVFKRIYNDPKDSDVYRKWAIMRERLQRMNLNQKQITILEMIAKGETNKGIATVVNLSEQGVKYHVGNLLEIFQTKNRLELRSKLHKIIQSA